MQEAHRGEAFVPTDAARGQQPAEQIERGGQPPRGKAELAVDMPLERQPQQRRGVRGIDEPDQAQRFVVRADQDVQAVVERGAAVLDAPRAAAELFGGFEDGNRRAACREFGCRRHAGVAAADYGDIHAAQSGGRRRCAHAPKIAP